MQFLDINKTLYYNEIAHHQYPDPNNELNK